MRIDDYTIHRIYEAVRMIDEYTSSVTDYFGLVGEELAPYHYEVFNDTFNQMRKTLIDFIAQMSSKTNEVLIEECRKIEGSFHSTKNDKLENSFEEISVTLENLLNRANSIPELHSDTTNPIIPGKDDDIYERLSITFKNRFNGIEPVFLNKQFDEDNIIGDIVTKYQESLLKSWNDLIFYMLSLFDFMGEQISVIQANQKNRYNIKLGINSISNVTHSELVQNNTNQPQSDISGIIKKKPQIIDKNAIGKFREEFVDFGHDLAKLSPIFGRYFTGHGVKHADQVLKQSLDTLDALNQAIDNHMLIGGKGPAISNDPVFFGKGNCRIVALAAMLHDIGMSDHGFALVPLTNKDDKGKTIHKKENGKKLYKKSGSNYLMIAQDEERSETFDGIYSDFFGNIRENHTLNSCYLVLKNRGKLKELGYNDEEIEEVAILCLAHSKSNSGLSDLNSISDYSDCFDRIDSLCVADPSIHFDRSRFTDYPKLTCLATESLALRVGDVSRESCPDDISQSLEEVHVDRDTINNSGKTENEEIENAHMTIGGDKIIPDGKDSLLFSMGIHAGEQNICGVKNYFDPKRGFVHRIIVDNPESAPLCTQRAIKDHIGELKSALAANSTIEIVFKKPLKDGIRNDPVRGWGKFLQTNSYHTNVNIEFVDGGDNEKS